MFGRCAVSRRSRRAPRGHWRVRIGHGQRREVRRVAEGGLDGALARRRSLAPNAMPPLEGNALYAHRLEAAIADEKARCKACKISGNTTGALAAMRRAQLMREERDGGALRVVATASRTERGR